MSFEVRFFAKHRGDEPVKNYLLGVNPKERAAIAALIEHLGKSGRLEYPHGKLLSGQKSLYEIRYNQHRIFYFYQGSRIILLHAFKKQSLATPQREIELAIQRMSQF